MIDLILMTDGTYVILDYGREGVDARARPARHDFDISGTVDFLAELGVSDQAIYSSLRSGQASQTLCYPLPN